MPAARRAESFDLERFSLNHASPVRSQLTTLSAALPRHSITRRENHADVRTTVLRTVDVYYRESLGIAQELEET